MVVGLHFFNPPRAMRLVEIARGERTAPAALEAALSLAAICGKQPIMVADRPGFIVNRLLFAMLREAQAAEAEGVASAAEIDAAIKLGLNHPMGPFELMRLIGQDVCTSILRNLAPLTRA